MRKLIITGVGTVIGLLLIVRCAKEPTALPEPPSLMIASPAKGVIWDSGSSYEISWTSEWTSGQVNIEVSSDAGSTWETVVSSTDDDGSYLWPVPSMGSSLCRIKVSDTDGMPSALSDTFAIAGISVIAPTAGESLIVGTTEEIRWSSSGTSSQVKIEIDRGGGWDSIAYSTSDDGAYEWLVGGDESSNAVIRVSDIDGSPSGTSETFEIREPYISVTSPEQGSAWLIGTLGTIAWTSLGTSGTVDIDVSYDGGGAWSPIALGVADDGDTTWTVSGQGSTNCMIRVTDSDGNPTGTSALFTITIPTPDITVAPTSLDLSLLQGSSLETVIAVGNVGTGILHVTSITDDAEWLTETPTNFDVPVRSTQDVMVTITTTSFEFGDYEGTITIESDDPIESQKMVSVSLTVMEPLLDMVSIPGGTFQMGSDYYGIDEMPIHSVTVSAFSMAKYEVTQAEYEEVMGSNPSYFQGANRPVERVSWWNAAKFCNMLSEREGLAKFYNDDDLNSEASTVRMTWSADGYRLPTEAEWEYACRAGSTTEYYWGDWMDDQYCWYYDNSGSQTHEVGTRLPNGWDLYDMSGNVWDWCNDWYKSDYYAESPSQDPTGPGTSSYRVIRVGGWGNVPEGCRSAYRYYNYPFNVGIDSGFRPVRR